MTGKATYTNAITGEQYLLGFEMQDSDTELSKAWDLVLLVARLQGWNKIDIRVKCGW
jgi:hypothetical protein